MLNSYQRTRLLLLTGIAVSAGGFYFLARAIAMPPAPGFGGSLFLMPGGIASVLVIAVALVGCTLMGTLIAGSVRFDAGLFCALGGMAVLSLRSGTAGDVLRETAPGGSASIFLVMACELIILFVPIAMAWWVLLILHGRGWLKADTHRDGIADPEEPLSLKLASLGIAAGAMMICGILLLQTDMKMQALIGVGLAAAVGTATAYYVYPVAPSPWYIASPLLVGIAGYVITFFSPEGWRIGQPAMSLAALSRALPIDYATAGPAGAIIGYWLARRWFGTAKETDESAKPAGQAA